MPHSISTLLTRNLHDVFGENDSARRRAAIDEIFTEDCVFYEPRGVYRGRDEIDRVAGAIKATHPDFRYQPIAEPEELGNGGRIQWVWDRPGDRWPASDRLASFGLRALGPHVLKSSPTVACDNVSPQSRQRVHHRRRDHRNRRLAATCRRFDALHDVHSN